MDYIYVNKTLKTPIYKQIASSITNAIATGVLKYNDKLPTEKELCRTFSISPTVVKMAYEELSLESMIISIKGKGSFVTNRFHLRSPIDEFYQIEPIIINKHLNYNYKVIMFDVIESDITAYRMLKLQPKELCNVILRVITANQNPVILQKIFLPEKYFPKLSTKFEHHVRLFDLIEHKYQHSILNMQNTFSPINASSDEAMLLKIEPDDAIYYVRSLINSMLNHPLCFVSNYFPGDFTEFEVIVHAV